MASLPLLAAPTGLVTSDDARIAWTADGIELETEAALRVFDLTGGALRLTRWVDRHTGAELLGDIPVEDFSLLIDGERLSSATPGWTLSEPVCEEVEHGALQFGISLARNGVSVRRLYLVYPGLSLVRGWLEITNAGAAALQLSDPSIIAVQHGASPEELLWMTGAELFGDSWKMRSEPLAEPRVFDSYDPPPGTANMVLQGDGVDLRMMHGAVQVWPDIGWAHSAHSGDVVAHDVVFEVEAGDEISFVVARAGDMTCDTTQWDPVVIYEGGASYRASEAFGEAPGESPWTYAYESEEGERGDMVYDALPGAYGERWRLQLGVIEPFISATDMHPDPRGRAVRVFTAPAAGRVTVSGSARNTGNAGPGGPGFRLGSQSYAPWFCLRAEDSGSAAYIGFDCMAHWRAEFEQIEGGSTVGRVLLAGHHQALAPGDTTRTPYAFSGLFAGDLDDMGQELLEWQYRYLWDYTREPWFPAVRMLGYWMEGTNWGVHGWVGGDGDPESAFRKVFRTADLMRAVGGDTYHRDWGWWDRAGDWNGPDFRASGDYLRQYGMGQLIYAFIYTVDAESSVARAHPDWLANPNTLDQSMPEVVDYEADLLHEFYERWGPYQWRNDSSPLGPRDGDDTVLLGQQQGFMKALQRFLDAHPDCAFQGVNGGGMAINWEYLGYSSGFQFTDGQSGALANYHASYLFPPDKINNMPDIWDPNKYDPATWRGLLCSNFDMTGDTFDPEKLEGLRELIDIYHFLQAREVVGRWVRIYHPVVEGDDESGYLQRLSWDRQRGVIITKQAIAGRVMVHPKGLDAEADYEVCFHESDRRMNATGAELMQDGIALTDPAPGELIYLNLSDHPGNDLDKVPPTVPRDVSARSARHMGVPGVEVRWEPGSDDVWLSHYAIWRDGILLSRVAKGCYYFDHSAGADPAATYEVRTIDGSGNESGPSVTAGTQGPRIEVIDDLDPRIEYVGEWAHEADFSPAHSGTLSSAGEKGASFTLSFEGRGVVWHSRLGAQGGLALVRIDDEQVVPIGCYAADEIPGWPAFEREWPESGNHVIRVHVAGQPGLRGTGTSVWLDALTVIP